MSGKIIVGLDALDHRYLKVIKKLRLTIEIYFSTFRFMNRTLLETIFVFSSITPMVYGV